MSKSFSNISQLFSNAYQWLCKSKKNHPPDSDIWEFKRKWPSQSEAIIQSVRTGTYQFDVQAKITLSCGETIALCSSQDALIIAHHPFDFCFSVMKLNNNLNNVSYMDHRIRQIYLLPYPDILPAFLSSLFCISVRNMRYILPTSLPYTD